MQKVKQNKKQISVSLFKKRWRKFKTIKRGYYSFLIIVFLYLLSFILPLFIGRSALVVKYNDNYFFPVFSYHAASEFNQNISGEANYRLLKKQFQEENGGNWVLLPLYPFGPNENLLDETEGSPPHSPSMMHILGTDTSCRDVLARIAYGFNVSISFALFVTLFALLIGIIIGALQGFFGGFIDISLHRFIEIWSTLPVFYVIIIVSSLLVPNFFLLCLIMTLFSWVGITFYVRGEFYREKSKDYVSAAVAMGAPNRKLIFKHILPNSLTPIISFAPFIIVGNIASLVSLDFLGFGLPPPTPSWGQLMEQGMSNIAYWWLVAFPLIVQFFTLIGIVFIGEAVREAFDPKVYSRLR
ncbi:MAG: ABC transporter permease subunit [Ignavibacteriae bacterium]|nr:ABC transporter permease subunit [Ignavibacteriota bacterium]